MLQARPEIVGHDVPAGDSLDGAIPSRTDALVVGPGLPPEDPRATSGVDLLAAGGPGVIDAGALAAIRPGQRFRADVVLTPHMGEARRLAATLRIDPDQPPVVLARALADATGATVLLKGAVTVIAPPDGTAGRSQADGPPQLATAGTGDVLAGIIGTLLAAGHSGPDAAALGALLHGRAGALAAGSAGVPLLAGDLPDLIPRVLGTILTGTSTCT